MLASNTVIQSVIRSFARSFIHLFIHSFTYTLFTLHIQTVLAQLLNAYAVSVKCILILSEVCAEATVMGPPCFSIPVWFRNFLGNDFTTVLARFIHVV